jgi:integrase
VNYRRFFDINDLAGLRVEEPATFRAIHALVSRLMRAASNRRRYLTEGEFDRLIKAASKGRYGHRDSTLVLLMVRHGLRVTEAIDLYWGQIDFGKAHLHVRRLKNGIDSVHPLQGDEVRALRQLKREQTPASGFVFTSERGGPMTRSNVSKMLASADERVGLAYCHPHMLRHTCGHLLADAGQDTRRLQLWLGHSNIEHTAKYSELSASPFRNFWR